MSFGKYRQNLFATQVQHLTCSEVTDIAEQKGNNNVIHTFGDATNKKSRACKTMYPAS